MAGVTINSEIFRRLTYDQLVRIIISLQIHYKPIYDVLKPYQFRRNIALIKGPDNCWLFVRKSDAIYYSLEGELHTFRLFKALAKPHMIFLDVGAGVGSYSIPAAKYGLKTIALEPNPVNFSLLLRNAKLNNVKIIALRMAAYSKKCKLNFPLYLEQGIIREAVDAYPIDEIGITPDIVKVDVDGAEISVIRGALNTLKEVKYTIIELRPSTIKEAIKLFNNIGKKGKFIEHMYSSGLGLLLRPRVKPSDFTMLFS